MVSLFHRASFDFTARLWDSVTGDCLKVFTDHTKYVFALSFSPDGSLLASGGGDGSLNMYDVKVGGAGFLEVKRGLTDGEDTRADMDLVVRREDGCVRD